MSSSIRFELSPVIRVSKNNNMYGCVMVMCIKIETNNKHKRDEKTSPSPVLTPIDIE
jgi:hypothetical protein